MQCSAGDMRLEYMMHLALHLHATGASRIEKVIPSVKSLSKF
jgi:hypothetical protein